MGRSFHLQQARCECCDTEIDGFGNLVVADNTRPLDASSILVAPSTSAGTPVACPVSYRRIPHLYWVPHRYPRVCASVGADLSFNLDVATIDQLQTTRLCSAHTHFNLVAKYFLGTRHAYSYILVNRINNCVELPPASGTTHPLPRICHWSVLASRLPRPTPHPSLRGIYALFSHLVCSLAVDVNKCTYSTGDDWFWGPGRGGGNQPNH